MKKYYFLIAFLLVLNSQTVLGAGDPCETKSGYDLYKCRVENICEPYKTNKVVFNTESLKKAEDYENDDTIYDSIVFLSNQNQRPLKKAIGTYKENMNSIYKCAMVNSQKNSVSLLKGKLLNLDKVGDLKKSIEPTINQLEGRLDMVFASSKCSNIDKAVYNKLNILKQTTYETCNFNFYMEYLKDYYKELPNALGMQNTSEEAQKETYVATEAVQAQNNILNAIDVEVEKAYQTYPLAYNAYSEFENNFPLHFILEIIKEDFAIFRDKLYKAVSPINQVVYKIHEAMSGGGK